jgi:hypothetical protein
MNEEVDGMHNATTWELPFGEPAELELRTDWGSLALLPVEAGGTPRLELTRGSAEAVGVHVEKHGDVVRVALDPRRSLGWFGGGWDCHFDVYVPRDVRAHIQTSAGSIVARDLEGCELGIKASAGKIELTRVYGLLHLGADAGSVTGRDVGGHIDVETHAGSVRLEVSHLRPGDHRIRATMGSVRLELARGMDVSIESRTSLGSVRNSYPSRPDAPVRLLLATEMGEVRVDEASFEARAPTEREPTVAVATPVATATATQPGRVAPQSAGPSASQDGSDSELDRILKMVESGELSAKEADDLLQAMGRV